MKLYVLAMMSFCAVVHNAEYSKALELDAVKAATPAKEESSVGSVSSQESLAQIKKEEAANLHDRLVAEINNMVIDYQRADREEAFYKRLLNIRTEQIKSVKDDDAYVQILQEITEIRKKLDDIKFFYNAGAAYEKILEKVNRGELSENSRKVMQAQGMYDQDLEVVLYGRESGVPIEWTPRLIGKKKPGKQLGQIGNEPEPTEGSEAVQAALMVDQIKQRVRPGKAQRRRKPLKDIMPLFPSRAATELPPRAATPTPPPSPAPSTTGLETSR